MAVLFLIFLDQICPKWIKLDQTWSNWISHQSKNVTIKSCHIYRKDKNGCFVFDFFGSDLSKMDQTWSNLISQLFSLFSLFDFKRCYFKKLSHFGPNLCWGSWWECWEGGVWGWGGGQELVSGGTVLAGLIGFFQCTPNIYRYISTKKVYL